MGDRVTDLALAVADLSRISQVYRYALGSRAMVHSMSGRREMAAFLAGGAQVAGELATQYAELALFLAAVKTGERA